MKANSNTNNFTKRFTCMCVFLVYMHTMCMPGAHGSQKGVGSSGSGVRDGYE